MARAAFTGPALQAGLPHVSVVSSAARVSPDDGGLYCPGTEGRPRSIMSLAVKRGVQGTHLSKAAHNGPAAQAGVPQKPLCQWLTVQQGSHLMLAACTALALKAGDPAR